jgi:hypothetical protein
MGSKKGVVVQLFLAAHGTPPFTRVPVAVSVLAWNRTRSTTFAKLRANPAHPEDRLQNFGFWISDFGLESNGGDIACAAIQNSKSKIQNWFQCPVEELNPVYDVRSVACCPSHSPGRSSDSESPRRHGGGETLGPDRFLSADLLRVFSSVLSVSSVVNPTPSIIRPAEGIEPPWGCLQNSCITVLPRWQFPLSRPARI